MDSQVGRHRPEAARSRRADPGRSNDPRWLGVTGQDQGAAIGGREMDIEHLDAGELIEHGA